MTAFTLLETSWAADAARLAAIRRAVFIEEQGVPEALEWDEHDAGSRHFLALDTADRPIGCARLLPDGQVGRMAVLPAWRGRGVGRALLTAAIAAAARQGNAAVHLSAQVHAAGFYTRDGFAVVGPEYEEAGISHVAMVKTLAA